MSLFDSPGSFDELLTGLPDAAAEAARIDVASGLPGGERSPEHERTLDLARQLRAHLRRGENTALRALIALGYDATSARNWLRSDRSDAETSEPAFQRPDDDVVRIPFLSPRDLSARHRSDRARQEGEAKREESLAEALGEIDLHFGTGRGNAQSD